MWPPQVVIEFQTIPPDSLEKEYHGAYNALLHSLFPSSSFTELRLHFSIAPQYQQDSTVETADYVVLLIVSFKKYTILIMVLKRMSDLTSDAQREKADLQIRHRLNTSIGKL